MKVKAGQATIDILKVSYEADQPILLVGSHGIGKSQLVEQAAKAIGIKSLVLDLSIMENVDLSGLPQVVEGKMTYATPSFLPSDGRGLLVFEELNRSPKYVQAPCLQLLTARRLNDYHLPKGWLPCAAINPADDVYTTEELDAALASRFLTVEVVPDVRQWIRWASGAGVDERVTDYVSSTPRIFESNDSNPRAWTYVSNLLRSCEQLKADEETVLAGISGLVGEELAVSFIKFSDDHEGCLDATDIIQRYSEERVRKTIQRWKKTGRLDLLKSTVHKLQTHLQATTNWQSVMGNSGHGINVEKFIRDLPADLRRQAAKFMAERNYKKTAKKKAG